jgi:hypothetical protein
LAALNLGASGVARLKLYKANARACQKQRGDAYGQYVYLE